MPVLGGRGMVVPGTIVDTLVVSAWGVAVENAASEDKKSKTFLNKLSCKCFSVK